MIISITFVSVLQVLRYGKTETIRFVGDIVGRTQCTYSKDEVAEVGVWEQQEAAAEEARSSAAATAA